MFWVKFQRYCGDGGGGVSGGGVVGGGGVSGVSVVVVLVLVVVEKGGKEEVFLGVIMTNKEIKFHILLFTLH